MEFWSFKESHLMVVDNGDGGTTSTNNDRFIRGQP